MKVIFNCSSIKKVSLTDCYQTLELKITFFDEESEEIIKRSTYSSTSEKERYREPIDKAYKEIKSALFNDNKYVEIEL